MLLNRRIRNLAIAGITIVSATLLTLSAAGASAATVTAATPAHAEATTVAAAASLSRDPSTPRSGVAASVCYLIPGSVRFYTSNCTAIAGKPCNSYLQGFIDGTVSPRYVANGCNVRVWLYTGVNRTGNNLCVSPGTLDGYLHQNYIWFWISANHNGC
jgi:hypothetical protein